MQLIIFKLNPQGLLELVEQDELCDDEDELTVAVVIPDPIQKAA